MAKGKKKKRASSYSPTSYYLLAAILLLTALVFSNATKGVWQTNWDDNIYILDNPHVTNLNLGEIFTGIDEDNYHPLTTLSYAIAYKLYGYDAQKFHLHNVILHIINVLLLFFLLKHLKLKSWQTLIVTALFAIHPMRVESVTWISERKDLLYALFFILSLLFYIRYIKEGRSKKLYYTSIIMFVLSLLSKSQAVVLSPMLLLIDLYFKRPIKKNLMEKLPFFLLSLAFGLMAVYSQGASGALRVAPDFAVIDRLFLVSYAVLFYIAKTLAPYGLSALYLYPEKVNGLLPITFYMSFAIDVLLAFLVWRYRKFYKEFLFGLFIYLCSVSVTLQIIPVGRAIVSDRYTYFSSIGIWIIVVMLCERLMIRYKGSKNILFGIFALYTVVLAASTFERNKIWDNPITLVTDAIEKADTNSLYLDYLYASRGSAKDQIKDYASAIADYDIAIGLNPNYDKALFNRALDKEKLEDYEGALKDYALTIKANPEYPQAFYSRGTLKINLKDYPGAIADLDTAISLYPNYGGAYNNRGAAYHLMGNKDAACSDWSKAAQMGMENSLKNVQKYCK